MARIAYGVSGDGSGHSSRARVVLEHLAASGHELLVATYDRGVGALSGDFEVCELEGLHLGKPLMALPMKGQFEQELNALLLAKADELVSNGGAGAAAQRARRREA